MMSSLYFIEGTYSVALYYAREVIKYEKIVDNLERLLFFDEIFEKLLSKEEYMIAKELLNMEDNNKVAFC